MGIGVQRREGQAAAVNMDVRFCHVSVGRLEIAAGFRR